MRRHIDEYTGLTSNPTTFDESIDKTTAYLSSEGATSCETARGSMTL